MIFDFIHDILYRKNGNLMTDEEKEKEFSPYVIQRYISMNTPEHATLVNKTSNQLHKTFTSKKMWYQFLLKILPRSKYKKIEYIKKNKNDDDIEEEVTDKKITELAKRYRLTKREVLYYINVLKLDINKIKID